MLRKTCPYKRAFNDGSLAELSDQQRKLRLDIQICSTLEKRKLGNDAWTKEVSKRIKDRVRDLTMQAI